MITKLDVYKVLENWRKKNYINYDQIDDLNIDKIVDKDLYNILVDNLDKIDHIDTTNHLVSFLKRQKEKDDKETIEWQKQCKDMAVGLQSLNNEDADWVRPSDLDVAETNRIIKELQDNLQKELKEEVKKKSLFTLRGKAGDENYDAGETDRRLRALNNN